MNIGLLDWIIIAMYLIGMVLIGYIASKKIDTMDDFILGGRRFTVPALVGTILATMVGSGMLMGAVGNVYVQGAESSAFWIYIGMGIGLLTMGIWAKRIRETNAKSLAEIVSAFGTKTRLTAAIVVTIYAVALVAINIAGLRTVIVYVFSGVNISIPLATVIAAAISIAYTAMGGFYAVVWTDVAQLGIMLLGVFIIGPIVGLNLIDGGMDTVVETYASEGMTITNPLSGGFTLAILGTILTYFLTSPGDPTMPQRALSAKTSVIARTSFIITGIIAFLMGATLLVLGGAIHVAMPGVEPKDSVLPLFIATHYPPIIKGICLAGIVAAVMSSFDSFLILATTHIMYDIGQSVNPDLKDEKIAKALPILTIVIGVIGIIIALFITSLLDYLTAVFSIVGSALVPVLVAALFFKEKTSKTAAMLSIILGGGIPAILFFTVGYDVPLGDPTFMGVGAAIITLIVGSLIFKDKLTPEELEAYDKK